MVDKRWQHCLAFGLMESQLSAMRFLQRSPAADSACFSRRLVHWGMVTLGLAGALLFTALPAVARAPDAAAWVAPSNDPRAVIEAVVQPLIIRLGREQAQRITESGAFRLNARRETIRLQGQRPAAEVIAGGVALGGREGVELIATGLRALEFGFRADGAAFSPQSRGDDPLLSKLFFLEAAARSLLQIQETSLPSELKRRADALHQPLRAAMSWLATTSELRRIETSARNVNQLFVAASALQYAAVLLREPALASRAEDLARAGLGRQLPDGTFPERGGFDSNYQTVSLAFLALYVDQLQPSAWRSEAVAAMRYGLNRFWPAVDPATGLVDTTGNTRTVPCGPARSDRGLGVDEGELRADMLPMRLYIIARTLGDVTLLEPARMIRSVGQPFDHRETCRWGEGAPRR